MWRIPVLAWFVFLLIENLHDNKYAMQRMKNPLSALDFGVHELGHFVFMPIGGLWQILGGSIFQCFLPLLALAGFLQKKWLFGATMCLPWLGLNLFDVAAYAADARARELPLSGPPALAGMIGGDTDAAYNAGHDWYQILSRTGHLSSDLAIAHGLRIAAVICFAAGIFLGGLLLVQMLIGSYRRQSKSIKN